MNGPDGVAVVDKETGWTSHDVVAKARGVFGTRKVGHSGTLDPDATGVLVLGVGRATRLLRFLQALPKHYSGELVLGVETDTLDAAGKVTATHDMSAVTPADVSQVARTFTGDIMQVPPMVSAVRVGGKRLHELARQGVEVERTPRPVTVYELAVQPVEDPAESGVYRLNVRCSAGTYIRSLAADIGTALGGGAHLRALRRLAVGSFTVEEAHPLGAFADEAPQSERGARLLSMAEGLRDLPAVKVGEELADAVSHGRVLGGDALGVLHGSGPWPVLDQQGRLLAVYEAHRAGGVKPAMVVAAGVSL